jgi:filamentous hemagglutinin
MKNVAINPELEKTPNLVNGINIDNLANIGEINLDFSTYLKGSSDIGLFTKSTNPNSPLFETRSQFIDQSKFFGSNYFYQKIGLNLNQIQTQFEQQSARLIGDQFFQTKIIEEQLRTISKNSFLLSTKETNSNNEIKTLIDNASSEYNRLGLTTNKSLTQTQINNLQQDIIWFETKNIDGQSYIVPKIYLSKITRDNLKNNLATKSTIFAKEDIAINSTIGSFTNEGSIIANNISITANNDIVNKNFSEIIASNNLSLTSNNGSITNFSNLTAQNNL